MSISTRAAGPRFCWYNNKNNWSFLQLLLAIVVATSTTTNTNAYEFFATEGGGGGSSRPQLNRRSMAGIWKLTPVVARQYPMKEFTVYPKQPKTTSTNGKDDLPELLLMLKEDGSFQQYIQDDDEELNDGDDEENDDHERKAYDINASWKRFQKAREQFCNIAKGTWDYRDGNLLLAADRLDESSYHAKADGSTTKASTSGSKKKDDDTSKIGAGPTGTIAATPPTDTLLKGRVVAKYHTQPFDNPTIPKDQNVPWNNNNTALAVDAHLSVPKGTINIGKFFYPKKHPSFFEQPMFRPIQKGSFALRQVLGPIAQSHVSPKIEKYQRADFYNKTFFLTSSPIPQTSGPPQGERRWSIKYNKFVHDPPKQQHQKKKQVDNSDNDNDDTKLVNIRVMEVAFYRNNTFGSIAGLGESAILRGKFDVIGSEKDQLWFQVVRFGFGRSVSGSVYSEGRMLSHEDAKAYWGTIHRMDENDPSSRLEVRGSVMLGWGLEPLPVARFIMRETDGKSELTFVDEDEDDDDEEGKTIESIENMVQNDNGDDDDWVSPGSSFQ